MDHSAVLLLTLMLISNPCESTEQPNSASDLTARANTKNITDSDNEVPTTDSKIDDDPKNDDDPGAYQYSSPPLCYEVQYAEMAESPKIICGKELQQIYLKFNPGLMKNLFVNIYLTNEEGPITIKPVESLNSIYNDTTTPYFEPPISPQHVARLDSTIARDTGGPSPPFRAIYYYPEAQKYPENRSIRTQVQIGTPGSPNQFSYEKDDKVYFNKWGVPAEPYDPYAYRDAQGDKGDSDVTDLWNKILIENKPMVLNCLLSPLSCPSNIYPLPVSPFSHDKAVSQYPSFDYNKPDPNTGGFLDYDDTNSAKQLPYYNYNVLQKMLSNPKRRESGPQNDFSPVQQFSAPKGAFSSQAPLGSVGYQLGGAPEVLQGRTSQGYPGILGDSRPPSGFSGYKSGSVPLNVQSRTFPDTAGLRDSQPPLSFSGYKSGSSPISPQGKIIPEGPATLRNNQLPSGYSGYKSGSAPMTAQGKPIPEYATPLRESQLPLGSARYKSGSTPVTLMSKTFPARAESLQDSQPKYLNYPKSANSYAPPQSVQNPPQSFDPELSVVPKASFIQQSYPVRMPRYYPTQFPYSVNHFARPQVYITTSGSPMIRQYYRKPSYYPQVTSQHLPTAPQYPLNFRVLLGFINPVRLLHGTGINIPSSDGSTTDSEEGGKNTTDPVDTLTSDGKSSGESMEGVTLPDVGPDVAAAPEVSGPEEDHVQKKPAALSVDENPSAAKLIPVNNGMENLDRNTFGRQEDEVASSELFKDYITNLKNKELQYEKIISQSQRQIEELQRDLEQLKRGGAKFSKLSGPYFNYGVNNNNHALPMFPIVQHFTSLNNPLLSHPSPLQNYRASLQEYPSFPFSDPSFYPGDIPFQSPYQRQQGYPGKQPMVSPNSGISIGNMNSMGAYNPFAPGFPGYPFEYRTPESASDDFMDYEAEDPKKLDPESARSKSTSAPPSPADGANEEQRAVNPEGMETTVSITTTDAETSDLPPTLETETTTSPTTTFETEATTDTEPTPSEVPETTTDTTEDVSKRDASAEVPKNSSDSAKSDTPKTAESSDPVKKSADSAGMDPTKSGVSADVPKPSPDSAKVGTAKSASTPEVQKKSDNNVKVDPSKGALPSDTQKKSAGSTGTDTAKAASPSEVKPKSADGAKVGNGKNASSGEVQKKSADGARGDSSKNSATESLKSSVGSSGGSSKTTESIDETHTGRQIKTTHYSNLQFSREVSSNQTIIRNEAGGVKPSSENEGTEQKGEPEAPASNSGQNSTSQSDVTSSENPASRSAKSPGVGSMLDPLIEDIVRGIKEKRNYVDDIFQNVNSIRQPKKEEESNQAPRVETKQRSSVLKDEKFGTLALVEAPLTIVYYPGYKPRSKSR